MYLNGATIMRGIRWWVSIAQRVSFFYKKKKKSECVMRSLCERYRFEELAWDPKIGVLRFFVRALEFDERLRTSAALDVSPCLLVEYSFGFLEDQVEAEIRGKTHTLTCRYIYLSN